jgi:hypothetical protein
LIEALRRRERRHAAGRLARPATGRWRLTAVEGSERRSPLASTLLPSGSIRNAA